MAELNKNPLVIVSSKFGAVGALLSACSFLLFYWIGEDPVDSMKFLNFIIVPLFVFFAMREFRKTHNGNELRFWQGILSGFIVYMLLGVSSALFIWTFLRWIDPACLVGHINNMVELLVSKKESLVKDMGENGFENAISNMKAATPGIVSLDDFMRKVVTGFFAAIVCAVGLRT